MPLYIYICILVITAVSAIDHFTQMTFEGLWSKHTHPKDFPQGKSLIGFTDLIGASHSSDFCFWDYGNLASEGLKLVAEFGDTHILEGEIMDKVININPLGS